MDFAQFLSDGHISIPQSVVEKLSLTPGETLKVMVDEAGILVLIKAFPSETLKGQPLTEAEKEQIYADIQQSPPQFATVQEAMKSLRNWETDW